MQPHERIYLAMDTNDIVKARKWAEDLKGKIGGVKIGLEFITAILVQLATMNSNRALSLLRDMRALFLAIGEDLFWDGKFDDIPNTVGGAVLGLAPLSPRFFNVHASAGPDAMKQAVDYRQNSNVLAVTLLTSFDPVSCLSFFGDEPGVIVSRWALQAVAAGVDGLICSPEDLKYFKFNTKLQEIPKMTPGIRPAWSVSGDQSRVMTPAKALEAGVTWMVIGRPITQYAEGYVKAVERIVEEIANAEAKQATS